MSENIFGNNANVIENNPKIAKDPTGKEKKRQKYHFSPYILGSQLIWSLHFVSNQFGHCYFQFAVNLVHTVNSLIENAYMANGVHS